MEKLGFIIASLLSRGIGTTWRGLYFSLCLVGVFVFGVVEGDQAFARASSSVAPKCELEIEQTVYLAIRGVRASQRRTVSKCLTKNIVEDLNIIKCRCFSRYDAIRCVQQLGPVLGIKPLEYLTLIGKQCDVNLLETVEKNFPSLDLK